MPDQNYVYLMHYKLEWFDDELKEWLEFEDNDSRISVHKTLEGMMRTAAAVFNEYDGDYYFGRPDNLKAESTEKYLVHEFQASLERTLKIKAELEHRIQVDIENNRARLRSGKVTRAMPVDTEIAEMWSKHGAFCYLRTYPESGRRLVFNFSKFDFIDLDKIPDYFPK